MIARASRLYCHYDERGEATEHCCGYGDRFRNRGVIAQHRQNQQRELDDDRGNYPAGQTDERHVCGMKHIPTEPDKGA